MWYKHFIINFNVACIKKNVDDVMMSCNEGEGGCECRFEFQSKQRNNPNTVDLDTQKPEPITRGRKKYKD